MTDTTIVGFVPPKTFIELDDAPAAYSGKGGYKVQVKADSTGLEFATTDQTHNALTSIQGGTTDQYYHLIAPAAPAANLLNVPGVANGDTTWNTKALFDATNPAMAGAAAPGTALTASHRDHVHPVDTSRAPANPLATDTLWDAAGDLVVGTGTDTAARLAKGTTGYFLKAGETTLEWASGTSGSGEVATDTIWTATGDIAVGTGTHTAAVITKGAEGTYLKSGSSTLEWATVSGEIYLSMAGGWTGTTLPDGGFVTTETSSNKVNFKGTNFAASANDQFHEFGCLMPRNYNGGTIIAKFTFFVPTSTDASNHTIILGLQGVCFGDGDAGDAAYGTVQTVTETIASSIAGKVIITDNTPAITIAGTPGAGKWVQFRVYREGDDTFAGDLTCLGCMITYTTTGL